MGQWRPIIYIGGGRTAAEGKVLDPGCFVGRSSDLGAGMYSRFFIYTLGIFFHHSLRKFGRKMKKI